jgi:hypothetical protein
VDRVERARHRIGVIAVFGALACACTALAQAPAKPVSRPSAPQNQPKLAEPVGEVVLPVQVQPGVAQPGIAQPGHPVAVCCVAERHAGHGPEGPAHGEAGHAADDLAPHHVADAPDATWGSTQG